MHFMEGVLEIETLTLELCFLSSWQTPFLLQKPLLYRAHRIIVFDFSCIITILCIYFKHLFKDSWVEHFFAFISGILLPPAPTVFLLLSVTELAMHVPLQGDLRYFLGLEYSSSGYLYGISCHPHYPLICFIFLYKLLTIYIIYLLVHIITVTNTLSTRIKSFAQWKILCATHGPPPLPPKVCNKSCEIIINPTKNSLAKFIVAFPE